MVSRNGGGAGENRPRLSQQPGPGRASTRWPLRSAGDGPIGWRASFVCSLWQAEVCHALKIHGPDNLVTPALVHAIVDDHSRYIHRIEVRATETEQDMVEIFANAVREYCSA